MWDWGILAQGATPKYAKVKLWKKLEKVNLGVKSDDIVTPSSTILKIFLYSDITKTIAGVIIKIIIYLYLCIFIF